VDTVSVDGHAWVCGVWQYDKRLLANGKPIYNRDILIDAADPAVTQLVDYTRNAGRARVHNGPAHSEVIVGQDGPALVEVGARLNGNMQPAFHDLCLGANQADLTALAFVRPGEFLAIYGDGGKVRLVRGVYDEDEDIAFARGPVLNRRYVELLGRLTEMGVKVSAAIQDVKVHNLMERAGLLHRVDEVEMLHGVRPALLRGLRDRGVNTRVCAVYGRNWWLHLLHRLAEYPRTVLLAFADLDDPSRIEFGRDYR
jgi:hypothetical protein